jgi:hypothetical protein
MHELILDFFNGSEYEIVHIYLSRGGGIRSMEIGDGLLCVC